MSGLQTIIKITFINYIIKITFNWLLFSLFYYLFIFQIDTVTHLTKQVTLGGVQPS